MSSRRLWTGPRDVEPGSSRADTVVADGGQGRARTLPRSGLLPTGDGSATQGRRDPGRRWRLRNREVDADVQADTRLLLRPEEAAEKLGISRAHLYTLLRSGELSSISLGAKARRIALEDLEDFVQRKRAEAESEPKTRLRAV